MSVTNANATVDAAQISLASIDFVSLAIVLIGGLIGGVLQPVVAQLSPKQATPPRINYLFSPILGAAAAGITVFVIANSSTEDPLQLAFFSLLCGMAFPAVLTSAVDSVGKRTNEAQQQVAAAAVQAKSDDPAIVANATEQLKSALVANPAGTVSPTGQLSIEASAALAVRNIAQTVVETPDQARQIVEHLKEVATVANSTGYTDTAVSAADELRKLSEDKMLDGATKKIAGEAADRIEAAQP